jgi:hypothetical protein
MQSVTAAAHVRLRDGFKFFAAAAAKLCEAF